MQLKKIIILIFVLNLGTLLMAKDQIEEIKNSIRSGDCSSSLFKTVKKMSEENNAEALGVLGWMYDFECGVKNQTALAKENYKKGCDLGSDGACFHLAHKYLTGNKIDQDRAEVLLQKGCAHDDYRSCNALGGEYFTGKVFKKDIKSAIANFEKACNGHFGLSCGLLGYIYNVGDGVKQDYDKAAILYKRGCHLEDGDSCFIFVKKKI